MDAEDLKGIVMNRRSALKRTAATAFLISQATLLEQLAGTGAAGAQDSGGVFAPGNQTLSATFTGEPRIGHEAALQQVSRAPDGTPMHIRADGPGLDGMDVPAFTTADFFTRMRSAQAAQNLQQQFLSGKDDDNGLERFTSATRRHSDGVSSVSTRPRRRASWQSAGRAQLSPAVVRPPSSRRVSGRTCAAVRGCAGTGRRRGAWRRSSARRPPCGALPPAATAPWAATTASWASSCASPRSAGPGPAAANLG